MEPATALTIGAMGGSALSGLFGGKKTKKVYVPVYSTEGKGLFSALHASVMEKNFPKNLASRYIGDALKIERQRRKAFEKSLSKAAVTSPGRVVTGNVTRGLLGETATRLRNAPAGYRAAGQAEKSYEINRLSNMQNIINLESNKPLALATASLLKKETEQAESAQRGAALGSLAQLAALGILL